MADKRAKAVPDKEKIARLDTGVPHIARVYDYCLSGCFLQTHTNN